MDHPGLEETSSGGVGTGVNHMSLSLNNGMSSRVSMFCCLIIIPADKGRATVVMDRDAYDTKVTTMLSDPATYKPVTKDPTATIQRCTNAHLLSLRHSNHISEFLSHPQTVN